MKPLKYLIGSGLVALVTALSSPVFADEAKKPVPVVNIDKNLTDEKKACNAHKHLPRATLIARYDNGVEKHKFSCVNGKPEGKQLVWYEDGKKEMEYNYANGKLEGKTRAWNEINGRISLEWNYANGILEGIQISFNESGRKSTERNYVNGKLHGKQNYYGATGIIEIEENYVSGLKEGRICKRNLLNKVYSEEEECKKGECFPSPGICEDDEDKK